MDVEDVERIGRKERMACGGSGQDEWRWLLGYFKTGCLRISQHRRLR